MSIQTDRYAIEFPADYDARSEYEAPLRGYLSGVVVRMEDGSRYQLFFIDPVRLQQELTGYVGDEQPYFWEPNLVVLHRVTTETIRTAVEGLVRERFFEDLKPLAS
jgi:hypothetical protein